MGKLKLRNRPQEKQRPSRTHAFETPERIIKGPQDLQPYQRQPIHLWIHYGLHRGHVMTDKGTGVGPFGYDVEYYNLGLPATIGMTSRHSRGCQDFLTHGGKTVESKDVLAEHRPGRWEINDLYPTSLSRHNNAVAIRRMLNSGEIKPLLPGESLSGRPQLKRPSSRPQLVRRKA
jgi:hypothetical protein